MLRHTSVGLIAGSAAMAGLIWAGRALWSRFQGPNVNALTGLDAKGRDEDWETEALADIAHLHALRDLRASQAADLAADTLDDPEDIDQFDLDATVGTMEHASTADDSYDAVDAEDVGTEWLLRATQATPPERRDANEVLEGSHIIEARYGVVDDASEDAYGSDQEGAPISRYGGTHEEDVAAELPVGNVDAAGNTELHTPHNPPDALGAPPTGQLSLTEEELARREH